MYWSANRRSLQTHDMISGPLKHLKVMFTWLSAIINRMMELHFLSTLKIFQYKLLVQLQSTTGPKICIGIGPKGQMYINYINTIYWNWTKSAFPQMLIVFYMRNCTFGPISNNLNVKFWSSLNLDQKLTIRECTKRPIEWRDHYFWSDFELGQKLNIAESRRSLHIQNSAFVAWKRFCGSLKDTLKGLSLSSP